MPLSAAAVEARNTFTLSAPAALSAAASAWAPAMPPSMIVIGRLPRVCASALMKSAPRPRSVPSDSHTRSTSCTAARNWAIAGSASERSTVCGFGFIWCRRTRAEPAGSSEMSRVPSDSGMSATARRSSSARAMMSLAVRTRASQVAAAAQPSSIMIAIGRARGRRRQRRMPQRAGGGDDDQRGERKPHQGEPPRRAGGRFLLGRDFEQKPRRRKIDAARPRRNEPQQPPQHRQRQQADQHERLGKADGQSADHAVTVGLRPPAAAETLSAAAAPMRACSASRSSLAGRSVRWMVKLQPRRSVSARISARWRATRAV